MGKDMGKPIGVWNEITNFENGFCVSGEVLSKSAQKAIKDILSKRRQAVFDPEKPLTGAKYAQFLEFGSGKK